MKAILRSVSLLLFILFAAGHTALADNADEMAGLMDGFYDGLASVIENNMDDPDKCLSEVDSYYEENKDTVERVQKLMAEAMEQAAAIMEHHGSMPGTDTDQEYMDAEELAEMARDGNMIPAEPPATGEMDRYTKALEAFMDKYPGHALRIAAKAMVFLSPAETRE